MPTDHQDLRELLLYLTPFPKEDLQEVVSRFHPRKVPRRTPLVREGEVCQSFHFVRSGCLRAYFLAPDGSEKTRYVIPPNGVGTALSSFLTREPSTEFLEAVEDSEILSIENRDWYDLLEQMESWRTFHRTILEMAYVFQNRRIEELVTLSAEERYRRFLERHRDLALRLPGKMVASYLDIAPETLSRLRARSLS